MNNRVRLNWVLSHGNYTTTVELIHKKSRQRYRYSATQGYGSFGFL
ncbi:hypothetical protein [Streptomyces sp. NPDC006477]